MSGAWDPGISGGGPVTLDASEAGKMQPGELIVFLVDGDARNGVVLEARKGKETTQRVCTKSHGTDQFSHLRQSKEKWSATIDKMISKGLEASDADLDEVTDYLAASFPAPPAKDAPAATAPAKK